mgnify:CR=1 FL=1
MNPPEMLNVCVAQMQSGENVDDNIKQICELLQQAPDADLVIFPENSLFLRMHRTGVIPEITLEHTAFTTLQKVVEQMAAVVLLGSVPLMEEGRRTNAMVKLEKGVKPTVVYRKIHLFDVDVVGHDPVRESADFTAGQTPEILDVMGWKLGLSICYDLRFSELYKFYAAQHVDAILIPSAFLVPTGRDHWHVLLRARAIESQCYVLAPAQAGSRYGHSLIVDPWGKVMAELDQGVGVLKQSLAKHVISKVRQQIPMKMHRKL